jgi:RNA polymerase alpha subunit
VSGTIAADLMAVGYVDIPAYARERGISQTRARQIVLKAWRQSTTEALILPNGARELPDDWPLEKVPLTRRCSKCLKLDGMKTVADVRALSAAELLRMPNFGAASLAWLQQVTARSQSSDAAPSLDKLLQRIARLETDNASLRARLQRIYEAAKRDHDEHEHRSRSENPCAPRGADS